MRRAIRTLAQIGTWNALIGVLMIFGAIHWTPGQVAASNALAVPILTAIQNFAEDKGAIPSVWKAHASSGKDPITRDPAR